MKKVIIITGGSEGLGKAIAQVLSRENKIIILARTKVKLQKTAKELGCDYLVCDIAMSNQIEKAVKIILKKYKKIDVLINNAGLWITGELERNGVDQIQRLIEVNTLGTILFSRAVVPVMKKQKQGLIINIISDAGLRPKAERSVYNASKYAVAGFTKSLEMELGKYGIAVTGVYPSKIKTKIFEKAGIKLDLNDAIEPEEVAKAVRFILSLSLPKTIPHLEIRHLPNK